MPTFRPSIKAAALAIALLPILSLSQSPGSNGKPSAAGGSSQTNTTKSKGEQTTTTTALTPTDLGDPWDALKLNSKARLKLSFRNANIDSVIEMIEKASHVTIVKDPGLTGPITVTTADAVGLSEIFHVFDVVLRLKGYELTRDKKILVISQAKKAAPPTPTPAPAVVEPPKPEENEPIIQFYPLQYASAPQVARAINDVFNQIIQPGQQPRVVINNGRPGAAAEPNVKASYEEFSNSVIINAIPTEQAQVATLIKEIDREQSQPQRSKTYSLEYAIATDVLPAVQSVLQANMTKGRGEKDTTTNPYFPYFFGNQNQNLAVADARTNSITVTGPEDLLKVADELIANLDHKMPVQSTTFVVNLENARADTVANLLTAAFGQRQGSQNNNNRNTTITPSNNIFNNSNNGKLGTSIDPSTDDKDLALKMQDPNSASGELLTSVGITQGYGQDGRHGTGQTMGHDESGKVVGIHDLAGQVTVVADPNTNSLIVVTTPDNADMVKSVISQLDKIPEQVMIQTIIVEATLDRSKQFGLEWNYAQKIATKSGTATGTAAQNFGLQSANPALQGFSYTLTGSDLTSFFNMLQTDTKFQVLSTPRIFTSNNMEAQINISQSIPYIVSTFQNVNGTNSFNYAFQDVGIVLTVTPHITSNGYVTLDVLQTANDLQGYSSFNAPIVNQREAETTVSAKDGETIILGGMIRNQITSTVNKVPLLGDIPILGNLFTSRSMDNQKTELLVFLTPKVVRDPAEAKRLKEASEKEMSKENTNLMKQVNKGKG